MLHWYRSWGVVWGVYQSKIFFHRCLCSSVAGKYLDTLDRKYLSSNLLRPSQVQPRILLFLPFVSLLFPHLVPSFFQSLFTFCHSDILHFKAKKSPQKLWDTFWQCCYKYFLQPIFSWVPLFLTTHPPMMQHCFVGFFAGLFLFVLVWTCRNQLCLRNCILQQI